MYCVIDIGSNTVRLVIYRVQGQTLRPILNNKVAAGLASYVDKQNRLTPEGIQKLIRILQEFEQILSLLPDCQVFPFATASLRNVDNTQQVLQAIQQQCRFSVRVLSGYEEAMLDYRGAARALNHASGFMADIGGGSTELIFFQDGRVLSAGSLPFGSLTLHRKFCSGVFPTAKEIKRMEAEVSSALSLHLPGSQGLPALPVYAIGGSARGLLSLYQHSVDIPSPRLEYPCSFLEELLARSEKKPRKLLREILKIAPDRVHTLLPGALILHVIARTYQCQRILTSRYGVREGYLDYMLKSQGEDLGRHA